MVWHICYMRESTIFRIASLYCVTYTKFDLNGTKCLCRPKKCNKLMTPPLSDVRLAFVVFVAGNIFQRNIKLFMNSFVNFNFYVLLFVVMFFMFSANNHSLKATYFVMQVYLADDAVASSLSVLPSFSMEQPNQKYIGCPNRNVQTFKR